MKLQHAEGTFATDDAAEVSAARCPLCRDNGDRAFEKLGYIHHACRNCGTLFVCPVPSPDALAAYYRNLAEQTSRFCWEQSHRHAHAGWRKALGEAVRRGGLGPLLDVGCGAGQFLSFAKSVGWADLEGIELSPDAAETARRASGAKVHEVDLLAAPLPSGHFAVVTLWDVLEHLPVPRNALRRVRELLRPGGLVVVATPNRSGITMRTLGARSLVVTPPEHLFLASRKGLAFAVTAEGFEVVSLAASDIYLKEWVRLLRNGRKPVETDHAAAALRPGASGNERRSYIRSYERLTGLPMFALLQSLANGVLRATHLGDQVVILAKKPSLSSTPASRPEPRR